MLISHGGRDAVRFEGTFAARSKRKSYPSRPLGGGCANSGLITFDTVLTEDANPRTLLARVGTIPDRNVRLVQR